MRIESCYFCSRPCYPSKGLTFVRNDAKVFRFCRSKCHKNFKMKRNPRKLGWTKAFRAAHGKEMTVDSTLTFAARRNAPVRYNRDLVTKTVNAMAIVSSIRARRERAHYLKRMRGNKARSLAEDRDLVQKAQHLLPPALRDHFPLARKELRTAKDADRMRDADEQQDELVEGEVTWQGFGDDADGQDENENESDEEHRLRAKSGRKKLAAQKITVDAMDVDN